MAMMLAAAVIVFGVAAALCASAVPPPFVKPTLVPGSQSAEYRLDGTFSLVDGFAVSVSCPEDGAAEWITSHGGRLPPNAYSVPSTKGRTTSA
jgi:hypothetical protein